MVAIYVAVSSERLNPARDVLVGTGPQCAVKSFSSTKTKIFNYYFDRNPKFFENNKVVLKLEWDN